MAHKFSAADADRLMQGDHPRALDAGAVVARLEIAKGEQLLEVGAGPGFFTPHLAQAVGRAGKVTACDVNPEMLGRLTEAAARTELENVATILSGETWLPLPDRKFDSSFVANVLHEAEDPAALLAEVWRVLAPGGQLDVVEWESEPGPPGPPAADRLGREKAVALVRAAGFHVDAGPENLGEAAPHHFLVQAHRLDAGQTL